MFNHSNCCSCTGRCSYTVVAKILLIVGGLNWGLMGLGMLLGGEGNAWNVVGMVFGFMPILEAIVYLLVGISAVVYLCGCRCKICTACVCENCLPQDTKPGSNV